MFAITSHNKRITSELHKSHCGHQNASDLPPVPPPLSAEEVMSTRIKHIADQQARYDKFKIDHPPPTIAPGTILQAGPLMLLRQWACQYNSYDITQIIKDIIEEQCDYKTRFVEELARNKMLRDQLEGNIWFDEWIVQSKNYTLQTNCNSKY